MTKAANLAALGNGPTFSVYASGSQVLTGFVGTKILYDTEVWDSNDNFSSSRFTPTVAGYYLITAGTRTNSSAGSEWVTIVYKNGSTYAHGSNNAATGINLSEVGTLVYMNGTTDYVEIYVYPAAGATTGGGSFYVYFNGCLVRGA